MRLHLGGHGPVGSGMELHTTVLIFGVDDGLSMGLAEPRGGTQTCGQIHI